jgi:hypothetical protein
MKKIFSHVQLAIFGLIGTLAVVSCKNEKIAEVVNPANNAKVTVSAAAKIEVGNGTNNYSLTGADMTVPFTVTFSSATTSAFTLDLSTNVDTVASLVTAGTLPAGTVAFPVGGAAVLPQITIPSGVKTFTTNIVVSRSAMEILFGKTVAAVLKVGAVGKGNTVDAGKRTTILVVKTGEILDANALRETSFGVGASNIINVVSTPGSYTLGSQDITFTVPVVLQGEPGAEYTVDPVFSADSVTKYLSTKLPNSEVYPVSKISYETKLRILAGTNRAEFTFTTKLNTLLAAQPAPGASSVKMPTVAFTLKNPSKYRITDKASNTVYFVIDPNFFRPYYGTPFVIKGAIGAVSDPIYLAYYDFGGQGVAYNDNNTKDGDGSWRLPDFVDVHPDYSPRSVVGWCANGEWLTYSVDIQEDGVYEMNILIGASSTSGRISAYMDNEKITPTQIIPINTGSNGNQLPNRSNVTLKKGRKIFKLVWDIANFDNRGVIFTRKS